MTTGLDVFDTTLSKTNRLLSGIERELGWEGRRGQSYHALRVVLHALRDRLPINDSVNFAAQLPLLVKGVYYDGWSSEEVPIKMDRNEFLNRIQTEFELQVVGGADHLVNVVLNEIFNIIDPGEVNKLLEILPTDIAILFY